MARASIREFGGLVQTSGGISPLVAAKDGVANNVVYTTATLSAAFGTNTKVIRICCDLDAYLEFGAAPVATINGIYLPADVVEYFYVNPGDKVSVYDGIS